MRAVGAVLACAVALGGLGAGCEASAERSPHPERSILIVAASGCGASDTRATGWLTEDGLVLTAAHAVRGSDATRVGGVDARVVAVDNRTDVAVLAPRGPVDAVALAMGTAVPKQVWLGQFRKGTRAVTRARAGDVVATGVEEPVDATTYRRQAFPVSVAIEQGDSGAPFVDGRGRAVGMAFAAARDGVTTAYAVAVTDIRATLRGLGRASASVETGRCS